MFKKIFAKLKFLSALFVKIPSAVCLMFTYSIRSTHREVFLEKGVLKICSKSTGDTHAEA